MAGDDLLTWEDLKARLAAMPRGAPFRLSQLMGMNHSQFYRQLNNSRRALSAPQARAAEAFFAQGGAVDAQAAAPPPSRRRVPVYGYAAPGGEDLVAVGEGQIVDWLDLPYGLELGPGEWFGLLPIGSTMEPRIFAGEMQLVRRGHPPSRGKDVVVEMNDGSALIKTYRGQRDGQVMVEQYNPPKTLGLDATKVKALHGGIIKL